MNFSSLRAKPGVLWRELDGEIVLLDAEGNRYFGIEGVGVALWRHLQETTSLDQLLSRLESEHDVAPDKLREDVVEFLGRLREQGLLQE